MRKIIILSFFVVFVIFHADVTTNKNPKIELFKKKKEMNLQKDETDYSKESKEEKSIIELKSKPEKIDEPKNLEELKSIEKTENIEKLKNIEEPQNIEKSKNIEEVKNLEKDKKVVRSRNKNKAKKTKETNRKKEKIDEKKKSEKFKKLMESYEVEAVIRTNKGVMSFYLYPEAAPVNVANFVYLAKNNFYNGLKFHRVLPGILVQGGDPVGNGEGSTSYIVRDEIVDWLNFGDSGMLAMANFGPDTNSSQFFVTMTPLSELNNKHTIIGEVISRDDLSLVKVLREGDTIIDIEIKGRKIDSFLNNFKKEIEIWDSVLKDGE